MIIGSCIPREELVLRWLWAEAQAFSENNVTNKDTALHPEAEWRLWQKHKMLPSQHKWRKSPQLWVRWDLRCDQDLMQSIQVSNHHSMENRVKITEYRGLAESPIKGLRWPRTAVSSNKKRNKPPIKWSTYNKNNNSNGINHNSR